MNLDTVVERLWQVSLSVSALSQKIAPPHIPPPPPTITTTTTTTNVLFIFPFILCRYLFSALSLALPLLNHSLSLSFLPPLPPLRFPLFRSLCRLFPALLSAITHHPLTSYHRLYLLCRLLLRPTTSHGSDPRIACLYLLSSLPRSINQVRCQKALCPLLSTFLGSHACFSLCHFFTEQTRVSSLIVFFPFLLVAQLPIETLRHRHHSSLSSSLIFGSFSLSLSVSCSMCSLL